jgi:hypothetical protein
VITIVIELQNSSNNYDEDYPEGRCWWGPPFKHFSAKISKRGPILN